MEIAHDVEHVRPEPVTAPVAAPDRPSPSASPARVPLPVAGLTVGHAEDPAERDADTRAITALSRLRRSEPHGSAPGDGREQVRRTVAPPLGVPEVGRAGGELGVGTSAEVAARRGGGRRLEEPVLRRMQTAFGADLSAVRIHDDAASATLSARLSARAFTTGKDVFFGAGQYAPDSPAGEQTLAHELAHTLQPAAPVRRELSEGDRKGMQGKVAAAKEGLGLAAAAPVQAVEAEELPDLDTSLADTMPDTPTTMDALRALTGPQVRKLATATDYPGPLVAVLTGPFEANWFKAKECLVFRSWPGGRPAFSHEASLVLMTALTALRGKVHGHVAPKTAPRVRARIREALVAAQAQLARIGDGDRAALQDRVDRLSEDVALPDKELITFLGSVGADSVTSDVDVSTAGRYTEWGVAAYNACFREELGLPFDPGTVFDLNVYAKDFIFKNTEKVVDTIVSTDAAGAHVLTDLTPGTENPEEESQLSDRARRDQDDDQETWALTHVARFLDERGWAVHTAAALVQITDSGKRDAQRVRFESAWARAQGFRARLQATVDELAAAVRPGAASAWSGAEQSHHAEAAVQMRAANQLYEAELADLRLVREQIAALRGRDLSTDPAGRARLLQLVQELPGRVSSASLYANEVYGSGGATVHAVIGMQGKKGLEGAAPKGAVGDAVKGLALHRDVVVHLAPAQWFQTFNDNLGDVLKDYDHYGTKHGEHAPDHWYAAFKMGKYADRMLDALPHLADGPDRLLSPEQAGTIAALPACRALRQLALEHVTKKAGVAKTDPKKLAKDPYFGAIGEARLAELRNHALALWARVRGDVSNGPPPAPVGRRTAPSAGTSAAAPTTTASGGRGPGGGSGPVDTAALTELAAAAGKAT